MSGAKKSEIKNVVHRSTFTVVLHEDTLKDDNMLPGRLVLTIKSTEDGKEKCMARYVLWEYRDRLKRMLVDYSQTLRPSWVRLLLALFMVQVFEVWTADVRQAYLQSIEQLLREVFINDPPSYFELSQAQSLQILPPLYGLCEARDLWHQTLSKHHR